MRTKEFQYIIWEHHKNNKRKNNFPWRKTRNPYHILISEIMLQQTQIPRVIPKYNEWLKAFPTLKALSRAPFSKVLSTWQGLGYNRRARFLKDTATIIHKKYNERVPRSPEELETLPGIGHYTARAVACFSYGICEPFLDTNIRRVYIHFFGGKKRNIPDAWVMRYVQKTQPSQHKREWYGALMDYGRDVLGGTKNNPNTKSASYTKQSPFRGSTRYIRAKIIDHALLRKNGTTPASIRNALLKDPYIKKGDVLTHASALIASLKKERLLREKNSRLYIYAR
ncbi:MAG: endonuclease III [Candidatus Niyogibacteria bacterium CG10_big_fil_rev_8_21_14_0_10_46_36]|uniref:Adenine DNA glycosylase n=1 Tax=Candidatus Niyogibacteria bacterium CG10_big_fil_rev_8_21_14_0_10_46_36 TaxID=1974726 RepID=A0A2H0TDD5_9BACT|nr:MAG: endonuclease III [Candidatus Niyogibacteria bacterium CG10_big_fil_rev_8_21_14_0_10_46_36]